MTKASSSDFAKSIVVLTVICLAISTALAFVNSVTNPIIAKQSAERAEAARIAVMPEADGFEPVSTDGLPSTITGVYKATNGAGYVFMITVKGYGGDMKLICGIDSSGAITECRTLSQSETKGLGTKTTEDAYRIQYAGKDASLSGVDSISGATISSNAYKNGIKDAFSAYETVKEAA